MVELAEEDFGEAMHTLRQEVTLLSTLYLLSLTIGNTF